MEDYPHRKRGFSALSVDAPADVSVNPPGAAMNIINKRTRGSLSTLSDYALQDSSVHPPEPPSESFLEEPEAEAAGPENDFGNDGREENDSAIGYDPENESTCSVDPEVYNYNEINRREYHSLHWDAKCWKPVDYKGQIAMDLECVMARWARGGKLYSDHCKTPSSILDIGTGTGRWATDTADELPGAVVLAIDLSPIQEDMLPPNMSVVLDNYELTWIFSDDSGFDLIHSERLIGRIKDWNHLTREAFVWLRPGGYFENVEVSPLLKSDEVSLQGTSPFLSELEKHFKDAGELLGCSFSVVEDDTVKVALQNAGFKNIKCEEIKVPVGSWKRENEPLGEFALQTFKWDVEGYLTTIMHKLGWGSDEITLLAALVRTEVEDTCNRHKLYYLLKVTSGQKPHDRKRGGDACPVTFRES